MKTRNEPLPSIISLLDSTLLTESYPLETCINNEFVQIAVRKGRKMGSPCYLPDEALPVTKQVSGNEGLVTGGILLEKAQSL